MQRKNTYTDSEREPQRRRYRDRERQTEKD